MEAFECKGKWFVPEFPNQQEAGILRYDPRDGATLEIIGGNFLNQIIELKGVPHPSGKAITGSQSKLDFIWGFTEHGRPVTLCNCRGGESRYSIGYIDSRYSADIVFFGCHFEKPEDIVFERIIVKYSNLAWWMGNAGFEHQRTRDADTGQVTEHVLKHSPPLNMQVRINDFSVSFNHHTNVTTSITDTHAEHFSTVEISGNTPLSLDQWMGMCHVLRQFLILGMGQSVGLLSLKGTSAKLASENEHGFTGIDIFYPSVAGRGEDKSLRYTDVMFTFQSISQDFQKYLNQWFALSDKLKPVFDLYFSLLDGLSEYREVQFLTLTQALEAFHRRMYGGEYMSKAEYEPVRDALIREIPDGIDEGHRDSLKSRIGYGYEFSLRKRLRLILDECLQDYCETIGALIPDRVKFVGKVVDTRNRLTHYTPGSEENTITDPKEFYEYTWKMRFVMQFCLLKELGFPAATVKAIADHNPRFHDLTG